MAHTTINQHWNCLLLTIQKKEKKIILLHQDQDKPDVFAVINV
jgi:hypothetical protein